MIGISAVSDLMSTSGLTPVGVRGVEQQQSGNENSRPTEIQAPEDESNRIGVEVEISSEAVARSNAVQEEVKAVASFEMPSQDENAAPDASPTAEEVRLEASEQEYQRSGELNSAGLGSGAAAEEAQQSQSNAGGIQERSEENTLQAHSSGQPPFSSVQQAYQGLNGGTEPAFSQMLSA